MAENKEVTFTTHYKGLELVYKPMGIKDAHGNKIPSVRCTFVPTSIGYAFTTSNPDLITWLNKHAYMEQSKIHKFDPALVEPVKGVEVSRKGVTSGVTEEDTTKVDAPTSKKNEPHVARVKR